jgi:hypothetical protein
MLVRNTYGYGTSLTSTYTIRNNLYHSSRANATLTTSSTITYRNNLYAGSLTNPGDTSANTALGYALSAGSPAINTGTTISDNGGVDYAGRTLYNDAPDIGAPEAG